MRRLAGKIFKKISMNWNKTTAWRGFGQIYEPSSSDPVASFAIEVEEHRRLSTKAWVVAELASSLEQVDIETQTDSMVKERDNDPKKQSSSSTWCVPETFSISMKANTDILIAIRNVLDCLEKEMGTDNNREG